MLDIDMGGNRFWYNDVNQWHRIGGPAVELWNGRKKWYLDGEHMSRDTYEALIRNRGFNVKCFE